MIRKYTFGVPLPTDAVIREVPAETGSLPYFTLSSGEEGSVTLSLSLHPEEVIFGLGQAVRGMDKRGHRYESWNSDVFNHTEERPSLYGSHNFIVFFSPERLLGVYLDDPGKIMSFAPITTVGRLMNVAVAIVKNPHLRRARRLDCQWLRPRL